MTPRSRLTLTNTLTTLTEAVRSRTPYFVEGGCREHSRTAHASVDGAGARP